MNKRNFSDEVTRRLASAPESNAKSEMIEELSENLYALYTELITSGLSETEAYARAFEEFGDERELLDYLQNIGQNTVSAINAPNGSAQKTEQVLDGNNPGIIDICVSDISINISFDNIPKPKLIYSGNMRDVTVSENSNTLTVRQTIMWKTLFSFGSINRTIQIILPFGTWNDFSVTSVSGSISINSAPHINTLFAKSVSGKINISGNMDKAFIKSVSGHISLYGTADSLTLQSISGIIKSNLKTLPVQMDISSTSGSCGIALPDTRGFTVNANSVSGAIQSNLPVTRVGSVMKYLDGGNSIFNIKTVSGRINIDKFCE